MPRISSTRAAFAAQNRASFLRPAPLKLTTRRARPAFINTRGGYALLLAAALAMGAYAGLASPAPVPTYTLTVESISGDSYVVDHGLSFSDCVGLWSGFPSNTVSCDPSYR